MESIKTKVPRIALVSGITGQDGSYLAELLLDKGYEVHGIVRRSSSFNRGRIEHLYTDPDNEDRLHLHYGDIVDPFSLLWILKKTQPDEIYHLAAQTHVAVSFETPYQTAATTGVGTLNLLESARLLAPKARIYIASTSELFSGEDDEYDEESRLHPRSPYGVAKLYSHEIARVYRESYGMFIARGILFNHESPRRGENFVTQKIIKSLKERGEVTLGNLDAERDWGYAPEYVEAMWEMLQMDEPDDFVIATGESHTVSDFVDEVCELAGLDADKVVKQDERFMRPNEVARLKGNPTKAAYLLGWKPKVKFKELVKKMYDSC